MGRESFTLPSLNLRGGQRYVPDPDEHIEIQIERNRWARVIYITFLGRFWIVGYKDAKGRRDYRNVANAEYALETVLLRRRNGSG